MKERLIGAVVLVTVAWLLIPVFLDSEPEPDNGLTTRTLSLPGVDGDATAQPTQTRTIRLREREEATPATEDEAQPAPLQLPTPGIERSNATDRDNQPAATDPETVAENPQPVDERAPQEATPIAAEPRAESPPAEMIKPVQSEPAAVAAEESSENAAGLWVVQVGSFGQKSNAQALMQQLIDQGFPAFVSEVSANGTTLHRVRVGPQKDRAAADAMVRQLSAKGQTAARSVPYP